MLANIHTKYSVYMCTVIGRFLALLIVNSGRSRDREGMQPLGGCKYSKPTNLSAYSESFKLMSEITGEF